MLCDMKNSNIEINELERNDLKKLFFNDCFLGKSDFEAINSGQSREEFIKFANRFGRAKNKSSEFSYIFDSYEKLSRFLAVKYDLGIERESLTKVEIKPNCNLY